VVADVVVDFHIVGAYVVSFVVEADTVAGVIVKDQAGSDSGRFQMPPGS